MITARHMMTLGLATLGALVLAGVFALYRSPLLELYLATWQWC